MRDKKRSDRPRPRLRRETVRKLDLSPLRPDELAQVVGGGYKASCPCATWN